MRIRILGSAAGGGFPQWNCACSNCRRLRAGDFAGSARTQTQLAWQAADDSWALLPASPDLRTQIESTPELWPSAGRHSPIADVVLTGAEADQALGLLLLREFHGFRVHASRSVRRILQEDNSWLALLARGAAVSWCDLPIPGSVEIAGAHLETLPLPGSFPAFVSAARQAQLDSREAVLGLLISPASGGPALAWLPSLPSLSDALLERLRGCAVLCLDGTFWTDDEPLHIPGVNRTARQMGHLPISGPGGSLARLAALPGPRRIYLHINNTNPILDEAGDPSRILRDAGWEVAHDGMELQL